MPHSTYQGWMTGPKTASRSSATPPRRAGRDRPLAQQPPRDQREDDGLGHEPRRTSSSVSVWSSRPTIVPTMAERSAPNAVVGDIQVWIMPGVPSAPIQPKSSR